jgi:hypothetical protein
MNQWSIAIRIMKKHYHDIIISTVIKTWCNNGDHLSVNVSRSPVSVGTASIPVLTVHRGVHFHYESWFLNAWDS